MARVAVQPLPYTARLGQFTLPGFRAWTPSFGIWTFGAGTAVVFFLSTTPIVRGVLSKVPALGNYYKDTTPDSDKPF